VASFDEGGKVELGDVAARVAAGVNTMAIKIVARCGQRHVGSIWPLIYLSLQTVWHIGIALEVPSVRMHIAIYIRSSGDLIARRIPPKADLASSVRLGPITTLFGHYRLRLAERRASTTASGLWSMTISSTRAACSG
jgi:hypothetical protein